jgi:hypothetical protein
VVIPHERSGGPSRPATVLNATLKCVKNCMSVQLPLLQVYVASGSPYTVPANNMLAPAGADHHMLGAAVVPGVTQTPAPHQQIQSKEQTVYITRTGKKYHARLAGTYHIKARSLAFASLLDENHAPPPSAVRKKRLIM